MKKNKKKLSVTLIVTISVLLVAGLFFGVTLYRDKQKFISAEEDIAEIIQAFNVSYDGSGAEKQEYCMRNNLKYSKGKLSCMTESSIKIGVMEDSKFSSIATKVGWVAEGSNLDSWKGADSKYIFANTYDNKETSCYIRSYKENTKQYKVTVGCSGPARAEWFPVRKD